MTTFSHAIVRLPDANFADGLTTADLGRPDYATTLAQHRSYCRALQACGLALTILPADDCYPDSTFVEDTAVVSAECAVLTHPGASSRQGEVEAIRAALKPFYAPEVTYTITPPGTLDGGDICEDPHKRHFFIGISRRTNLEGARQLASCVAKHGYSASFIPVEGAGILHLKSGIAYLGDNRLVLIDALAKRAEFAGYEIVRIAAAEAYAANCVRVNHHLLVPRGYPQFAAALTRLGYALIQLPTSEFQKMDGGLSCLSLRLP